MAIPCVIDNRHNSIIGDMDSGILLITTSIVYNQSFRHGFEHVLDLKVFISIILLGHALAEFRS